MSKTTGTAKRRKKPSTGTHFEDGLVRVSTLTGFLNAQTSAIEAACKKVAQDKADLPDSGEHCRHYLDGAREMASITLDMLPAVKASALIDAINRYMNDLTSAVPQIVKDTGTPESYVQSYVNGSQKMADIIKALTTAPCFEEPVKKEVKNDG